MNKKKYLFFILLPTFFNILFFVVSLLIPEQIFFNLYLTLIFSFLNTFIATIYIIFVNIFAFRQKCIKTIWIFILSILVVLINNMFVYLIWGLKTGLLLEPDFETLIMVTFSIVIPLISVLISTIVLQINYMVQKNVLFNRK